MQSTIYFELPIIGIRYMLPTLSRNNIEYRYRHHHYRQLATTTALSDFLDRPIGSLADMMMSAHARPPRTTSRCYFSHRTGRHAVTF